MKIKVKHQSSQAMIEVKFRGVIHWLKADKGHVTRLERVSDNIFRVTCDNCVNQYLYGRGTK